MNDVAREIIELSKDISEKLKNDVRDTDRKLTTVCNLLQDQLLIVDVDGIIQFANDSIMPFFHNTEIIGKNLFDVVIMKESSISELYQSIKKKSKIYYH